MVERPVMTDDAKLLPCPFCGSTDLKEGGDDKIVGVYCRACEAQGPNHYGRLEWNNRAIVMTDKPDAKEESDGAFYKRMNEKMLREHAPGPDEVARLTERLRKAACGLRVDMYDYDAALMDEAADALTRLSASLAKAESELAGAREALKRYTLAVQRLGEDSGHNRLTFFEAPISKMPNDDLGMEAVRRWRELNDAGVNARAILAEGDET